MGESSWDMIAMCEDKGGEYMFSVAKFKKQW